MQSPDRSDILNIGGFSDAVFSVVASFLSDDAGRFVADVEAVESNQGGWDIIAPSVVPFGGNLPKVPREMTAQDIAKIQEAFVAAAKRALAAGFEWLELHYAHCYLTHEFYSPLANNRTDNYGGSFDNRIRFLLETFAAVRKVWPERSPIDCSALGDGLDRGRRDCRRFSRTSAPVEGCRA